MKTKQFFLGAIAGIIISAVVYILTLDVKSYSQASHILNKSGGKYITGNQIDYFVSEDFISVLELQALVKLSELYPKIRISDQDCVNELNEIRYKLDTIK